MKKDFGKITIVTLAAVMIRIVCTPIFGGDPIASTQAFGSIAGKIGIIPSVIIMFTITYAHLTLIGFYCIRKEIAGNYRIGFLLGLIVGMIWLFGMLEAGILENLSQYKQLLFGLSEAIPMIVLGLSIAHALRKEKKPADKVERPARALSFVDQAMIAAIVSVSYLALRYIAYAVVHIESRYLDKPTATFLWTFGNGILIGILYAFTRSIITVKKTMKAVVVFGMVFFGVDWFLYNMFVPAFFDVPVVEFFGSFVARAVLDMIGVCVGVYVLETILRGKRMAAVPA